MYSYIKAYSALLTYHKFHLYIPIYPLICKTFLLYVISVIDEQRLCLTPIVSPPLPRSDNAHARSTRVACPLPAEHT